MSFRNPINQWGSNENLAPVRGGWGEANRRPVIPSSLVFFCFVFKSECMLTIILCRDLRKWLTESFCIPGISFASSYYSFLIFSSWVWFANVLIWTSAYACMHEIALTLLSWVCAQGFISTVSPPLERRPSCKCSVFHHCPAPRERLSFLSFLTFLWSFF